MRSFQRSTYYEELQGDAEEVRARMEAMETRQEETSIIRPCRAHAFAAEHYAASLGEKTKTYLLRREKNY